MLPKKQNVEIPHPGELLKEILDEMELSQYRFSKLSGIDPAVLSGIIAGKRRITIETAIRIGRVFNCGARDWINHQVSYDLDHAQKEKATEFDKIKPLTTCTLAFA
ncbi:MAG: HigA family addiction module antidote protein [Opitutales bacterium]|nr:HigA family addiction module antidote protein [Opitutales bacterium]